MRKTIGFLLALIAILAASGTAAQAAPTPSSPETAYHTLRGSVHKEVRATFARNTAGGASSDATSQTGPSNCEDLISGEYNAQYDLDTDLLEALEWEWSAKVLCTGTPGSSLASIQIANSTLWNDFGAVGSGDTTACSNCNLANSLGSWECIGTPCANFYWESASEIMVMPVGFHWTSSEPECIITGTDQRTLTCNPITNTDEIPVVFE